jgi:hypothetical protein
VTPAFAGGGPDDEDHAGPDGAPDGGPEALAEAAARLRQAGDLPGAVALLLAGGDDLATGHQRLRYLFELQDHAGLQAATSSGLRNLGPQAGSARPYLMALLHFAELCCLPPPEIEAALAATHTAAQRDAGIGEVWQAVRSRQQFRARLQADYEGGASIISLGLNCVPWHLPGRWGFRRMEDFSALFGPFALAGHTIPGVLATLENDFRGYCDPASTRIIRTQRGKELAVRKDRTAHWNHNRGPYWLRDDAAPMRDSLAAKAALFREACRRPDAVFMLATCPVQYPEEALEFLPRLQAVLPRFTGRRNNRIFLSNQTARQRAPGLHVVDRNTRFAYCPHPSAEYVWHDDAHADTQEGRAFERRFAGLLLRALLQWQLLRPRASGNAQDPAV